MKHLRLTVLALAAVMLAACTVGDESQRTSPLLGPTCKTDFWIFGHCIGASGPSNVTVASQPADLVVQR